MPNIEFSVEGIVVGYRKSWWITKLFTDKIYSGIKIQVNEKAYEKCLHLQKIYIRRIRIPKNNFKSRIIILNPESDDPKINYLAEHPLNSKITFNWLYEKDNLFW